MYSPKDERLQYLMLMGAGVFCAIFAWVMDREKRALCSVTFQ